MCSICVDMLREMEAGEHHWRTIIERTSRRGGDGPYAYIAVLYAWRGVDGGARIDTFKASNEDFHKAVKMVYQEWKRFGLSVDRVKIGT